MAPNDIGPLGFEVIQDPGMDLAPQPLDIICWIITRRGLSLGICRPADIHNMQQHICVPEVIQKLVSQALKEGGGGGRARLVKESKQV